MTALVPLHRVEMKRTGVRHDREALMHRLRMFELLWKSTWVWRFWSGMKSKQRETVPFGEYKCPRQESLFRL